MKYLILMLLLVSCNSYEKQEIKYMDSFFIYRDSGWLYKEKFIQDGNDSVWFYFNKSAYCLDSAEVYYKLKNKIPTK